MGTRVRPNEGRAAAGRVDQMNFGEGF